MLNCLKSYQLVYIFIIELVLPIIHCKMVYTVVLPLSGHFGFNGARNLTMPVSQNVALIPFDIDKLSVKE